MMANCTHAVPEKAPTVEYITDVMARVSFAQQGWGVLGIDTAAHAPDHDPLPLQIKDQHHTKGLGSHAPGQIMVELDGEYDAFEADIGVQWQGGNAGSVVFQVYVDGDKRFDSGAMREKDAAKPIRIAVAGAQELGLVATDAGDGITCDVANWANARLTRSAAPKRRAQPSAVDMAPFARVMTWDPHRNDGCRSNRVEEFRAEDVFLGSEVALSAEDAYVVPTLTDGTGCIGLEWYERRSIKEVALRFADAAAMPPTEGVQVQRWAGESPWQGEWQALSGAIETQRDAWRLRVDWRSSPQARAGTWKIRWLFPNSPQPIIVRSLSAFTYSAWGTAEISLQLERPMRGRRGDVEIYNGEILTPAATAPPLSRSWDLFRPLNLKIRYSKPGFRKSDRTVLRLRLPSGAFGIAVDDILANEAIHVRDARLFVVRKQSKMTLAEYRRKTAGRKPILAQVRRMPDQTFAQAMAKVHHPVQDNGPVMLSLACHNHKFVVAREGGVRYEAFAMTPRFGSGNSERLTRHLDGGWLPIPAISTQDGGVVYRQRTFVAPFDERKRAAASKTPQPRAVCVAEFTIENPRPATADASLSLAFAADAEKGQSADLTLAGDRISVQGNGRLLAVVDTGEAAPLTATIQGGVVILTGALPARSRARCVVYVPAWEMKPDDLGAIDSRRDWRADVEAYWKRVMRPATQVTIPDELLANVIRASQVYCLMAARNEDQGERIAPWISSPVYGPLESEANSIILGMDLMGHHDFARRSLDFFIKRYSPAGFLTTGYTLVGTGWHLWTLAEHYRLTRDSAWLRRASPDVARVCSWVARQREKTKKLDPRGEKMPEYGLVPPGVVADWNVFAYRSFLEGHYCAGLREAAQVLAAIGSREAPALLESAADFRDDILHAYHWTQERCPVVPLRNGSWVPASPGMLNCFGPIADFYPGEDGARSWAGDVEIGAQHLVPLGVLDPHSTDVAWMTDYLEDYWFLQSGMGDYPEAGNHEDWFNLGGFAKVQPYYGRIADVYAMRDDVKPFIRSYFNAIPSLLNTENLSFWEHFHNQGAWNKTHETGWFLQQTRTMFVMERGDELWLAPFVTSNWLKNGEVVEVRKAPTHFGDVSYRITSHTTKGLIEAVVEPPKRNPPKALIIRVRHPDGKPMKSVTVNGRSYKDFDPKRECVRLKPRAGTITIRVRY